MIKSIQLAPTTAKVYCLVGDAIKDIPLDRFRDLEEGDLVFLGHANQHPVVTLPCAAKVRLVREGMAVHLTFEER